MGRFLKILLAGAILLGEIQNCLSQNSKAVVQCSVDTCQDFIQDTITDNANWVTQSGHGHNSAAALYLSQNAKAHNSREHTTKGRLKSKFLSFNGDLCVRFYCNAIAKATRSDIDVQTGSGATSGVIDVMIQRGAKFYPADEKDRPSAICNSVTWELHQTTLSARVTGLYRPSRYQVVLEGRVDDNSGVVMGLDDIAVFNGPCRDDGITTPATKAAATHTMSSSTMIHSATTTVMTTTTTLPSSTAPPSASSQMTTETFTIKSTATPRTTTPTTTTPSETEHTLQANFTQSASVQTEETTAEAPATNPTAASPPPQSPSPSTTLSTSSETTYARPTNVTQTLSRQSKETPAHATFEAKSASVSTQEMTPSTPSEETSTRQTKMTQTASLQTEETTENTATTLTPRTTSSSVTLSISEETTQSEMPQTTPSQRKETPKHTVVKNPLSTSTPQTLTHTTPRNVTQMPPPSASPTTAQPLTTPTLQTATVPTTAQSPPTNMTATAPTTGPPKISQVLTSLTSSRQTRSTTQETTASPKTTSLLRIASTISGITTTIITTAAAMNASSPAMPNSTRTMNKVTTSTSLSTTANHLTSAETNSLPSQGVTIKPGWTATPDATPSTTTLLQTSKTASNITRVKITQTSPPSPPTTATTFTASGTPKAASVTTPRPTPNTSSRPTNSTSPEHPTIDIGTQRLPDNAESTTTGIFQPATITRSRTPGSQVTLDTTETFELTAITGDVGTPRLTTSGVFSSERSPSGNSGSSSDTEKEALVIATAVLSAVLFLTMTLGFLLLCCLRHRRMRGKKRRAHPPLDEETMVTYEMTGVQNARSLGDMTEDAGSLEFPLTGSENVYTNLPWSTPGSRSIPAIVVSDHNDDEIRNSDGDDDDNDDNDSDTGGNYTVIGRPVTQEFREFDLQSGRIFDPTYTEISTYPAAQPTRGRSQGSAPSEAGHRKHMPLNRLSYPNRIHGSRSPPSSPRPDLPHERSAFTAVISISGSSVSSKTTTTSSPRSSGDFHLENHRDTLTDNSQPRRDRRLSSGYSSPIKLAAEQPEASSVEPHGASKNHSFFGDHHQARERRLSREDRGHGHLRSDTPTRDPKQLSSNTDEPVYSTVVKTKGTVGSARPQPNGIPGSGQAGSSAGLENNNIASLHQPGSPSDASNSTTGGHARRERAPLHRQQRTSQSSLGDSPSVQHPRRKISPTSASGQQDGWGRVNGEGRGACEQRERGEGHDTDSGRGRDSDEGRVSGGSRHHSGLSASSADVLCAEKERTRSPLRPKEGQLRPGFTRSLALLGKDVAAGTESGERKLSGTVEDQIPHSPALTSVQHSRDLIKRARNPFLNENQDWSSVAAGAAQRDLTSKSDIQAPKPTAGQLRFVNSPLHRTSDEPLPQNPYWLNSKNPFRDGTESSTRHDKVQNEATVSAPRARAFPVGKNPFEGADDHRQAVLNDRCSGDGATRPDVQDNVTGEDSASKALAPSLGPAVGERFPFPGSIVEDQRKRSPLPVIKSLALRNVLQDSNKPQNTRHETDSSSHPSAVRNVHRTGDVGRIAEISRPAVLGSATPTKGGLSAQHQAPIQATTAGSRPQIENRDEQNHRNSQDNGYSGKVARYIKSGVATNSRHGRYANGHVALSENAADSPFSNGSSLTADVRMKPPSLREAPPGRSSLSTKTETNAIANKSAPPHNRSDDEDVLGSADSRKTLTMAKTNPTGSQTNRLTSSSVTSQSSERVNTLNGNSDHSDLRSSFDRASVEGEEGTAATVRVDELGPLQVSDV